ncbi:25680_t:CDS:10 [Gigaspora margarita]|uniref:25680_t:CDS:1 n=1 Tax=Gigaspora margarita TaxID=4874 RepID=A0ABM8W2X7_GIGMA|nr:25680_t:CDS:10 [Gigaspora margarita]
MDKESSFEQQLNVTELISTPNSLLSQDEFGPEALVVYVITINVRWKCYPKNYENATEIQDINYCSVTLYPLNFYPLFDQYILVTYTHATNTSDTSTYMDRTTNWYPNEYVVNNISPKKGFLRLSTINDIGTNPVFSNGANMDNGGYALVYANTTSRTFTYNNTFATQFSADAGIYAIMLGYNQSTTPQALILHQLTAPNLNFTRLYFTRLYCFVDFVYIGHSCIAYVTQTHTSQIQNGTSTVITTTITPIADAPTVIPITTTVTTPPTTITSSENFYLKIRFLSTGSVLALDPILPQNNGSLTIVRTLPYGGYALIDRIISGFDINFAFELYDESNALANYNFPIRPLITNFNAVFDILPNNTMLVALSEATTTSWQILSVQLPSLSPYNGSKNLTLNANSINITNHDPIKLNKGNLYIYQSTINGSKTLRQLINTKSCNLGNGCSVSGKVVTLKVLDCTFNDPNAQYYIEVDNDFIKSSIYNEPILGIDPNKWTFNIVGDSGYQKRAGVIQGVLRLTNDGTQYFQSLNDIERERFFNHLINELTILIPTKNGRLSSNGHYQKDTSVHRKNKDLRAYQRDLPHSIWMKLMDTNDITIEEHFDMHKTKFILLFVSIVLFILIFLVARLRSPESENFCILTLGLTIFRFVTYIVFTFTDAKLIPNIFIPSVAFLVIPVTFNLVLAFTILFSEKSEEYIDWFVQYGRVAVTFALASGTNIYTLLILRAQIPQFILQIIVLNSSVLFDVVPIFAAVASGLSVLASITSKLFFIRHKAYSPYLSHFVEKRKTIIMDEKVEKQTYDTNEVVDTVDRKQFTV